MNMKKLTFISAAIFSAVFSSTSQAQTTTTLVDDNFDGSLADASYYGSSNSNAVEGIPEDSNGDRVSQPTTLGSVGLVTGTSGRQMHTVFPTQTLESTEDIFSASVTFTTPATVDDVGGESRIGLFDHLERAGLFQDTSYSTAEPNADYNDLPGFYTTIDVDSVVTVTNQDLDVRRHNVGVDTTGRLLATSGGFTALNNDDDVGGTGSTSGPDLGYTIVANTTYTVAFEIARTNNNALSITATITDETNSVTYDSLTRFDLSPASFSYGMIALGANGNTYGSNTTEGDADNGITFNNVTVSFFDADGVDGGTVSDEGQLCVPVTRANGTVSTFCL